MTDIQKQLAEALEEAHEVLSISYPLHTCDMDKKSIVMSRARSALAAHRQQEARGPLTVQRIQQLWLQDDHRDFLDFARAIEAAHGIKGE